LDSSFLILEQRGFEVKLVNAAHVKNLPGRKTDVFDCLLLQQLHTYGLLNGSFRPKDEVCVLRSFLRLRDTLVKDCSSHVLRMQKALTEMNIQIHRLLSDITGYTGIAMIRAILAGAHKLARLFYRMFKFGAAYVEKGQTYYELKYKERLLRNLSRRAKEFGFQLTPLAPATDLVFRRPASPQ
jgi:Transposase